jgi:dolichol kinase
MPDTLSYRQELARKLIHIASSIIPLSIWYYGMGTMKIWIVSIAITLILLDFGRRYSTILQNIYRSLFLFVTRPIEFKRVSGAAWVFSGAALTILLFREDIVIVSLLVLSLADSAAAIVGLKYGNTKLFQKSLEGSIAFFLTSLVIILSLTSFPLGIQIIAAMTATVSELFSNETINDNLLVPFATAATLSIGTLL